jgi:hypothetical protein
MGIVLEIHLVSFYRRMKMKKMLFVCWLFVGCNQNVSSQKEPVETKVTKVMEPNQRYIVQQTQQEWWQPTQVIDNGQGSVAMTWSSSAAYDEYERQQKLNADLQAASAPDDASYVFDDSFNGVTYTIPRQDFGARDKLGVEKSVSTSYAALMPKFQLIAADNANRMATFTGSRLSAVQSCNPRFWNVSIESVTPSGNGFSIDVSALCGSRASGVSEQLLETWSLVDGALTLSSRTELISKAPGSY